MPNDKSPVHDGLTKEYYEHFWDDFKFYFINSLKQSKLMVTSLFLEDKLMAKKDRDKRFGKYWWPISLLNVDTKILPESLVEILKHVFPELISST